MRALSLISLISLTLLLAPLGCGSGSRPPSFEPFENNVLELAQARGNLTTFVKLVEVASFVPALTQGAQITVLAPTDLAFNDLPAGRLNNLRNDPDAAKELLRYHLVPGRRKLNLLALSQQLPTFLGQDIAVRADKDEIFVGGAGRSEEGRILSGASSDQPGRNGLLHTIDAVLAPPAGNLLKEASVRGYDALVTRVNGAGLDAVVTSTNGAVGTLFAPTNEAFDRAMLRADLNPDIVENILLNHVLQAQAWGSDLMSVTGVVPLSNVSLAVEVDGSDLVVGGSKVTAANIRASNGVLHEVADVLLPPTAREVAAATPNLSRLVEAIRHAGNDVRAALNPDTLGGDPPITIFAPNNGSFEGVDTSPATAGMLDDVLRNHVVVGQVLSSTLTVGRTLRTALLGQQINVGVANDGRITLNVEGTTVTSTITGTFDLRTLSGVVHVIEGILLPAAAP